MVKKLQAGSKMWKLAWVLVALLALSFTASSTYFFAKKAFKEVAGSTPLVTQEQLEKEFNEIAPLPGAVLKQSNKTFKPTNGVVEEYYIANKSFPDIRAYYDDQLLKRGWRRQSETDLTSWWKQRGEKMVLYCQGNISADLYYTGQEAESLGYTYAFGLSWGFDDCD